MAKGKGKGSRRPVSKDTLAQVRYGQKHGLISKRAKTTGGKVSRRVQKKVENLNRLSLLPTFTFNPNSHRLNIAEKPRNVPVKVPRAQREQMRDRGYDFISSSYAVAPATRQKSAQEALDEGRNAGTVRGGDIFSIQLNEKGIDNYADLSRVLKGKKWEKLLDDSRNLFSFTFYGFHPRDDRGHPDRNFINGKELIKYLERYKWTEEAFDNFELLEVPPGMSIGATPDEVYEAYRARTHTVQNRRGKLRIRSRKLSEERVKVSQDEKAHKAALRQKAYRERKGEGLKISNAARMRVARRAVKEE